MKDQRSRDLFERSQRCVPGGVHSPVRSFRGVGGVPRFIHFAQGAEIEDVDGYRYIDYCLSWGPLLFGHQDPEVKEQVLKALDRGWSYGTAEPYSLELAEWITREVQGIEKIRFVNSGTEAVLSALRLARAATGRTKILKFSGCYHGHVDALLVKAGSGLADSAIADSAGISTAVASETLILELDDPLGLEQCFDQYGSQIAAVILEPLPANYGLLIQQDSFLKQVVHVARKAGSLVIFDEVISGFRVGLGGMAEYLGLQPDLVTFGKVIGGGFPVGAYAGSADLMDLVAPVGPVYQAGTLSANPVAMIAGLANLKKLKRENPYALLEKKAQQLVQELQALETHSPIAFTVQQFASLFWLVFGETESSVIRRPQQIPVQSKPLYAQVFHRLLDQGVYLAPSAYEVCFLSTAHTWNHLEKLIHALRVALQVIPTR